MKNRKYFHISSRRPDYIFLGLVVGLVVLGFIFLSSASFDLSKMKYDNAYYFLWHQITRGVIPGVIAFFIGYFAYYRKWRKVAASIFITNLLLLALLYTPFGLVVNGSHRWLNLGGFSFQPSEFLKFTFVIYLASLLSSIHIKRMKKRGWKLYIIFILVLVSTLFLILFQPATTMAIIIGSSGLAMYFVSGAKLKHILLTMLLGSFVFLSFVIVTPYRFRRVVPIWNKSVGTWVSNLKINTEIDNFHIDQSVIAIGDGGVYGVGFGKSTSKYTILPEPMGDSIFAVIAEEIGFIGSSIIIILYAVLFLRMLKIASRTKNEFAKLVVVGFASIIVMQTIIHIAANSGALPFTGITLPFISYGGTSIAVLLGMMGVVANISKHTSLS